MLPRPFYPVTGLFSFCILRRKNTFRYIILIVLGGVPFIDPYPNTLIKLELGNPPVPVRRAAAKFRAATANGRLYRLVASANLSGKYQRHTYQPLQISSLTEGRG